MRLLIANLGAEEDDEREPAPRRHEPAAAVVATLWQALFDVTDTEPAFSWLPPEGEAAAWLATDAAAAEAHGAGLSLAGPAPDVVRSVHDKAFAHRAAATAGHLPGALAECIDVLDPGDLEPGSDACSRIEARVASWPAWTGGRFTLKPRLGSSGRGRFGGELERLDRAALEGALPRLQARGGALLEPWLERSEDLSVQLVVQEDGQILLLGTTGLDVATSGLYRGQLGTFDRKARVTSGSAFDEPLREAAVAVALEAAERGFRGACGVDAFVFRGPGGAPVLRPVVEFNARYTVGTVVIGILRRRRRQIVDALRLDAHERAHFAFRPEAPPGGWPESAPPASLLIPLGPPDAGAAIRIERG